MTETDSGATRRTVLKTAGVTVAAGVGAGAVIQGSVAADSEWAEAESPTEKGLNDVVYTADGPYAVGEGGNVATRNDGEWELVIESGPNASNNPLNSVDVTDDGERIYFLGGSGALGAYDVLEGVKHDYTGPTEEDTDDDDSKTSTWEGIAVSGEFDHEQIICSNGSGETLEGWREEQDGEMCLEFGNVNEPAGGSTIPELDFADDDPELCYGVDTSQMAFQSEDLNETWEIIGVDDAAEAFTDVVGDTETVFVSAGGGLVYRLDCDCMNWTPIDVGSRDLLAIDQLRDDGDTVGSMAAAAEGYVYERTDDGWIEMETPVEASLLGVAYGDGGPDVAVGSGGTIVERT